MSVPPGDADTPAGGAADAAVQAVLDRAFVLIGETRFGEAVELLTQACAQAPRRAQPLRLLGAALHQSGDIAGALDAFDRSLMLEPGSIESLRARCALLQELGRGDEALDVARRGLDIAPRDTMLLTNLAILLEGRGELERALAVYDEALAIDPDWLPALLNRGALLGMQGRYEDSLADARRVVRLAPGLAEARLNCADALLALARFEEAVQSAEVALALRPGWEEGIVARGAALAALGRIEDARIALAGLPAPPDARLIYLNRGLARQACCDWRHRDELIARFEAMVHETEFGGEPLNDASLAFPSLGLPLTPETRMLLMRAISAGVEHKAALLRSPVHGRSPPGDGRLRLGYLTASLYRHPNTYQTRMLYRLHDRERFEVHCFSLHPGDGSAVRREVESGVERFHDLAGHSPEAVAGSIADAGIDVLVDLNGYTRDALPEVLALRPAPIQVLLLGFPCTSGARFIDYFVADHVVAPAGCDEQWSESLARMPGSCYPTDDRFLRPKPILRRSDFGLPDAGFVFCGFNAAYKIEPGIFDVWMRVLRRVPGSVLWLLTGGPEMEGNLRRAAETRGVEAQRLVFADFLDLPEHLARYPLADLFLDTFIYNAHTTATDALRAGLPVLTTPGSHMVSRVAASTVIAAGMPDLAVGSAEDYEERAVALAAAPGEIRALHERLATLHGRAPLFDSGAYIRALETAYLRMQERRTRGMPPAPLDIAQA